MLLYPQDRATASCLVEARDDMALFNTLTTNATIIDFNYVAILENWAVLST